MGKRGRLLKAKTHTLGLSSWKDSFWHEGAVSDALSKELDSACSGDDYQ